MKKKILNTLIIFCFISVIIVLFIKAYPDKSNYRYIKSKYNDSIVDCIMLENSENLFYIYQTENGLATFTYEKKIFLVWTVRVRTYKDLSIPLSINQPIIYDLSTYKNKSIFYGYCINQDIDEIQIIFYNDEMQICNKNEDSDMFYLQFEGGILYLKEINALNKEKEIIWNMKYEL